MVEVHDPFGQAGTSPKGQAEEAHEEFVVSNPPPPVFHLERLVGDGCFNSIHAIHLNLSASN